MGGFEIIFWIAIIVFSILRGMQSSQKPPPGTKKPLPDNTQLDPFQEAIRDIEAALRGEVKTDTEPNSRSTFQEASTQPTPKEARYESEFHSMESPISSKNLENETNFQEFYTEKPLETRSTYEDSFPESKFFDDSFKHAHPEQRDTSTQPPKSKRAKSVKSRLKNKRDLTDAVILQTILNRRQFPPRRA